MNQKMDTKIGACSQAGLLLLMVSLWCTNSHALPTKSMIVPSNEQTATFMPPLQVLSSGNAKRTTSSTISPIISTKGKVNAASNKLSKRNKRDIPSPESKAQFGVIPGAQSADDALRNFMLYLQMMKHQQQLKNTLLRAEDSDETLDPPIELGLGKEPGSGKSTGGIRSNSKGIQSAKEEPTGVPIIIFKNHMHKKSSLSQETTPEKLYFREAATGSIYERDPKIMRKLFEQIASGRRRRAQNDDGRFYSVGQLLEHSSRLNGDIAAVPRLVL